MTSMTLEKQAPVDGKLNLITSMRADPEIMSELRRGLEARKAGKLVSWEKVKNRFEQPE